MLLIHTLCESLDICMGGAGPWAEAKGGKELPSLWVWLPFSLLHRSQRPCSWQRGQLQRVGREGSLPNQILLFISYFSPGPKPFLCGLQLSFRGRGTNIEKYYVPDRRTCPPFLSVPSIWVGEDGRTVPKATTLPLSLKVLKGNEEWDTG